MEETVLLQHCHFKNLFEHLEFSLGDFHQFPVSWIRSCFSHAPLSRNLYCKATGVDPISWGLEHLALCLSFEIFLSPSETWWDFVLITKLSSPSAFYRITQNRMSWKGPLEIIQSNPLLKQIPTVGYTEKHPVMFWISPEKEMPPLLSILFQCCHTQAKKFFLMCVWNFLHFIFCPLPFVLSLKKAWPYPLDFSLDIYKHW